MVTPERSNILDVLFWNINSLTLNKINIPDYVVNVHYTLFLYKQLHNLFWRSHGEGGIDWRWTTGYGLKDANITLPHKMTLAE